MKKLFIATVISVSCNYSFSNEVVFSCITGNGKNISLSLVNGKYEYRAINSKSNKVELALNKNQNEVIKKTPEDNEYDGGYFVTSYKINNGDFSYYLYKSLNKKTLEIESGIEVSKKKQSLSLIKCLNQDEDPPSTSFKEKRFYGEGTYKVGVDVPAGEYKVYATSDDGTGTIFVSTSANYRDLSTIVHHEIFNKQTYVTVEDGQYLRVNFGKFELVK